MNVLRRYVMVIFVGVSLLFGIQVPNFLDQYSKRVDAHLKEVTINLEPYQKTANRRFKGELSALIAHYKKNNDVVSEGGAAIGSMYQRKIMFEKDKLAISGGAFQNLLHIATDGNPELLQETLNNYSHAVPLNQDALVAGGIIALITMVMIESVFGILGVLTRGSRSRRKNTKTTAATAR